uniref:Retrotransposon gag domain-containing protein n=1 Tax=Strigamia maritima TaxID=126957 RepID=T1IN22_STRMM
MANHAGLHMAEFDTNATNTADRWHEYLGTFEFYAKATAVTENAKYTTLIFVAVQKIAESLDLNIDNAFDTATKALSGYFEPKKNHMYEAFIFFSAIQKEGEAIDPYITKLGMFSRHCGFVETDIGNRIRDQLVIGCRDPNLRARLLRENDMATVTLNQCNTIARSFEKVIKQASAMEKGRQTKEGQINMVRSEQPRKPTQPDESKTKESYTKKFATAAR